VIGRAHGNPVEHGQKIGCKLRYQLLHTGVFFASALVSRKTRSPVARGTKGRRYVLSQSAGHEGRGHHLLILEVDQGTVASAVYAVATEGHGRKRFTVFKGRCGN
jgi:hypothetical protein